MAINLLNENSEAICPKCGFNIFREEKTFSLKKVVNKDKTVEIKKDVVMVNVICNKCNEIFLTYKGTNGL